MKDRRARRTVRSAPQRRRRSGRGRTAGGRRAQPGRRVPSSSCAGGKPEEPHGATAGRRAGSGGQTIHQDPKHRSRPSDARLSSITTPRAPDVVDGSVRELPQVRPQQLLAQVHLGPASGEAAQEGAVAAVEVAVGALGREGLRGDAVGGVHGGICGAEGGGPGSGGAVRRGAGGGSVRSRWAPVRTGGKATERLLVLLQQRNTIWSFSENETQSPHSGESRGAHLPQRPAAIT